jgi:hypothetical protein
VSQFAEERDVFSHPKACSTNLRFRSLSRYPACRVVRRSMALPPYTKTFCATCGVIPICRTAATQVRRSYALSPATVIRREVSGNSPSMAIAASRSAVCWPRSPRYPR